MERVADDVKDCLKQATFGGKPLLCYRGIKPDDYIFTDEGKLKNFLQLSEENKQDFPCGRYHPNKSTLWKELVGAWSVDDGFVGDYNLDYSVLNNTFAEYRTCWKDKYTVSIYPTKSSVEGCRRTELQPLPDFVRWLKTSELHYLPYEERLQIRSGAWDDIPATFLPSKVLRLAYKLMPEPPQHVTKLLALLAWVPEAEVVTYFEKLSSEDAQTLKEDMAREQWKKHKLYSQHTKLHLEKMCHALKIPVASSLVKHDLVKLIADKNEEPSPLPEVLYSGKLVTVPSTTKALSRVPVSKLRAVLSSHAFPTMGNKEELVIRVFLLKENRVSAMFAREQGQFKELISIIEDLILAEREASSLQSACTHTYRRRAFTQTTCSSKVQVPADGKLDGIFEPLLAHLAIVQETREEIFTKSVHCGVGHVSSKDTMMNTDVELKEMMSQPGARIKVKWTKEQIGSSGWKPGWFTAVVQAYDYDDDTLTVTYPSEPGSVYTLELSTSLALKEVKLVKPVL